ncbi:MAG: Hsp20/alpha crystallin family protein [Phycisphaeraceae bacterium]
MLPMMTRRDNPFELLQREMDRAFDRAWGGRELQATTAAYPVDISEDDNNIIVEAELPGFKKDEINVTMEQGVLSIAAQREAGNGQDKGERHLTERQFTRVARSFRLPVAVDEANVQCKLDDGVLTVTLPKREEVKPRKIEVK